MRITFVAKWDTIDIALKQSDDVIAYARLRQFSSSGVVKGDHIDVRMSTKSFVVDDLAVNRPPLLLLTSLLAPAPPGTPATPGNFTILTILTIFFIIIFFIIIFYIFLHVLTYFTILLLFQQQQ